MIIEHYEFGKIRIRGVDYDEDVIVLRGKVHSPWMRQAGGHIFAAQDLGFVIGSAPAIVCLGIGSLGRVKIREETIGAFVISGTRVVIDRTGSVIEEFNRLSEGGFDVAAALHITC